jgi:hypothetical protein
MSAGKKKVNPRRRPATEADVKRAKASASDEAVKLAIAIFLTVLCDDFNFDKDQLKLAWERMDKLSEEIKEHRVSAWDLVEVLREEYGIDLMWVRK